MCYFSHAFKHPKITVDAICHELNHPKFGRVEAIVGTGTSGTLMLVPVSIKSGLQYCVVRKKDDKNHSGSVIETYIPYFPGTSRYVIIDDLTETGTTVGKIIKAMTAIYAKSRCVGIILYQSSKEDKVCEGHEDIPISHLETDIDTIASQARMTERQVLETISTGKPVLDSGTVKPDQNETLMHYF